MKAISFEVDELPMCEAVDEYGNFTFGVYVSNMGADELSETMDTLTQVWGLSAEVALTMRLKVRDIYKQLYDSHDGSFDEDSLPLFNALRADCQWIIDQIDARKAEA